MLTMLIEFLCVCVLQLSMCRSEMSAVQKDRDRLLDQATGAVSCDEVLQTARTERDELNDRLYGSNHSALPVIYCSSDTALPTIIGTRCLVMSGTCLPLSPSAGNSRLLFRLSYPVRWSCSSNVITPP